MKTKYIRYKSHTYGDVIFTFPGTIKHNIFWSAIYEKFPGFQLISAGFVDSALHCYGESTSLKVKSLEEDTSILLMQFETDKYN